MKIVRLVKLSRASATINAHTSPEVPQCPPSQYENAPHTETHTCEGTVQKLRWRSGGRA
jgi:hypothetical protein